jgi:hypothetical protein
MPNVMSGEQPTTDAAREAMRKAEQEYAQRQKLSTTTMPSLPRR